MFAGLCTRGFALECRATLAHFPRQGLGSLRSLHQSPLKPSLASLSRSSAPTWTQSMLKRPGLWSPNRHLALRAAAPRRTFDPRFFSSNAAEIPAAELPVISPPSVGVWLIGSAALVLTVIVVGGVTRLTESGLSITEWRPIAGVLPPLTHAEWEEEFRKYQASPEFKLYVSCHVLSHLLLG